MRSHDACPVNVKMRGDLSCSTINKTLTCTEYCDLSRYTKTDVDESGGSEFIGSDAKAGKVTARYLGPARQIIRARRRVSRNTLY